MKVRNFAWHLFDFVIESCLLSVSKIVSLYWICQVFKDKNPESFHIFIYNMFLQKNIKHLRKSKGMSQETLAAMLGKVKEAISSYERGSSTPPFEAILKFTEIFEISIDDLVFRDIEHEGSSGKNVDRPATSEEVENLAKRVNELLEHRVRELERYIREKDPEGAKELGI